MFAMHGAMQGGVSETLQRAMFIALLLDGFDRQRHRINVYAILLLSQALGQGECVRCSLVWWMWRQGRHKR